MLYRLCNPLNSPYNNCGENNATCTETQARSIAVINGTFTQASTLSSFLAAVYFDTIVSGSTTGVEWGQHWIYNYATSTWSIHDGFFDYIFNGMLNYGRGPIDMGCTARAYLYSSNKSAFLRSQVIFPAGQPWCIACCAVDAVNTPSVVALDPYTCTAEQGNWCQGQNVYSGPCEGLSFPVVDMFNPWVDGGNTDVEDCCAAWSQTNPSYPYAGSPCAGQGSACGENPP